MKKLFLAMAVAIVTVTVVSAQENSRGSIMVVSSVQTDKDNGYDGDSELCCGIKFNIRLSGVTKVELESVDGNPLAGKANIKTNVQGNTQEKEWKTQVPSSRSLLPIPQASHPARTISFLPCLATFTADTGFPFTKTVLWLIISVFIRL